MVNGDEVKYIGVVSIRYLDKNLVGKVGHIIDGPYQLKNVPNEFFVDVKWKGEKQRKDILLERQPGHVVNVKNLKVL